MIFVVVWASLVAQLVKNPPAKQETWIRSLGQEDPLKKGMATHSSIFAWEIPWTEEPGGLQSMGSQSQAWLSDEHFHFCCCLVTKLGPILCDPMDCSLPGSFVHGISQARIHWNGLPFPSPGDLPTQGLNLVESLPLSHQGRRCAV